MEKLWVWILILLLVVMLIVLSVLLLKKPSRDTFQQTPIKDTMIDKKDVALKNIALKESGFYSLATMLQATFGSHIYLSPDDKNFVGFNVITPLPDTLQEFNKRKNLIETPNLDVIYAPSVIDLRRQAVKLVLPNDVSKRYYIVQFISLIAEDVATISSKTNAGQIREWILYSSSYAPDCMKPLPGYVHSPSVVLYMMIRVATNLQDPNDYDDALRFVRQFRLEPYSFPGLPPATTDTLDVFKQTFPDLTDINVRDFNVDVVDYYNRFVKLLPLQTESLPLYWRIAFSSIGVNPYSYTPTYAKEMKDALTMTQQFEYNISVKGIPIKNNYNTSQIFYVFNQDPLANQIEVVGRAWLYIFANPPNEAIYFQASVDSEQKPLDGSGNSRYTLNVPRIPEIVPGSNGFWSVCSYTMKGFNTLTSDFTVGKGVGSPTKIHLSPNILDKQSIPSGDLFLLVPEEPFYIVFRVYAPQDSILLRGSNPFFPEMIYAMR